MKESSRSSKGSHVARPVSTEQRLMDVAATLFASKGYAAVGIREIAREAGLTIGSLYHYASSKEDLFIKLLRSSYVSAIDRARKTIAMAPTPAQRLQALIRLHIVGEVTEANVWELERTELEVISPEARAALIELRDEFEQLWRDIIEEGISDGSFAPEDPAIVRISILRMCNGVVLWYRPDGRLTLDEISDIVFRQALLLLRAG
ncbi:TetR/AcrR family transcriptional regulator [Nonomuraea sp. NPDC050643]|uniref:TetR/AcrR family transcriptional regulator n=1 Tax=Nonomuraea sp. NPDC050643 TaxID=3155660 RepID=UPI0033D3C4C0